MNILICLISPIILKIVQDEITLSQLFTTLIPSIIGLIYYLIYKNMPAKVRAIGYKKEDEDLKASAIHRKSIISIKPNIKEIDFSKWKDSRFPIIDSCYLNRLSNQLLEGEKKILNYYRRNNSWHGESLRDSLFMSTYADRSSNRLSLNSDSSDLGVSSINSDLLFDTEYSKSLIDDDTLIKESEDDLIDMSFELKENILPIQKSKNIIINNNNRKNNGTYLKPFRLKK